MHGHGIGGSRAFVKKLQIFNHGARLSSSWCLAPCTGPRSPLFGKIWLIGESTELTRVKPKLITTHWIHLLQIFCVTDDASVDWVSLVVERDCPKGWWSERQLPTRSFMRRVHSQSHDTFDCALQCNYEAALMFCAAHAQGRSVYNCSWW